MLLHLLEHAHRVLQGHVALRHFDGGRRELGHALGLGPGVGAALRGVPLLRGLYLVVPGLRVVGGAVLVEAREDARLHVEGVLLVQQVGRVRVVQHVLVLPQVMLENVVKQTAVESDVGARADRTVDVRHLGRARVARIDDDPRGAVVERPLHPLRRNGVVLDVVGADRQDDVGVLHIAIVVRHRTATECCCQTGNRGAVSNTSLVVDGYHP